MPPAGELVVAGVYVVLVVALTFLVTFLIQGRRRRSAHADRSGV
jgi:hypothetical protein